MDEIKLENVWKIYKLGKVSVVALSNINLSIKKSEFVAIQGPSGSGKSTCINIIGCLDVPTKGDVYLEGKNVGKLTETELAAIRGKKIGFVFQQFNLIPTLTALENVMLPMVFQNKPKDLRIKRAKQLLKLVGLETRVQHKPAELSGGERQRVSIARALANNPSIIIADEPTGNLDSKAGKNIIDILKNLNRKYGTTIVLVGMLFGLAFSKAVEIIALSFGITLIRARTSLVLIIGVLIFSFIMGIISGLLPAIRASRQNVVDALRYE